jgi:transcriptional regulator with XRE-family HTH domain
MKKINPFALKTLRNQRGWSQEKLGEIAKIDKQTIWRIERGKAGVARTETIQRLARAFSVEEAVLTGDAAVPQKTTERDPPKFEYQFNVDSGVPNALYLIMQRYGVPPWQVLELTPYLFCWAAEESLRRRRERINRLKRTYEDVQEMGREIQHLECTPSGIEEAIAAELESIEGRDVFAFNLSMEKPDLWVVDDELLWNPFASFLDGLATEFQDVMELEQCPWEDWPIYRVCMQEAKDLVGGDSDLAEQILSGGSVSLFEMPKELRYHHEERTKWIREKIEAHRKAFRERIVETREAST